MNRNFFLTVIAAAIVFAGCNKIEETTNDGSLPLVKAATTEMIPVAILTDDNKIEHLFLQSDVQEFFSTENPGAELFFVEVVRYGNVINDVNDSKSVELLYRVHYAESNVTETSIIPILTLKESIIYFVPGGGGVMKTTCTTSDCVEKPTGCQPQSDNTCSKCGWPYYGKCTRSTTSLRSDEKIDIKDAILYAISVY
jgi:hypothetical protein